MVKIPFNILRLNNNNNNAKLVSVRNVEFTHRLSSDLHSQIVTIMASSYSAILFPVVIAISYTLPHALFPITKLTRPLSLPLKIARSAAFFTGTFLLIMNAPIYGKGIPFLGKMTDFSTLSNRKSPNEYIITPNDFGSATPHSISPVYNIDANKLKGKIHDIIMGSPRVRFIGEDKPTNRLEYVQRTLIFRFPDVVTVQIIPISDKQSTFAMHSYSTYGHGDLGVNKKRVKGWIAEIDKAVKEN